uniref:Uncharacterized protein n=1 Tax=Rhizophora mucronata TaxID=61149 RepID=A0A2P2NIT2_RHIMU
MRCKKHPTDLSSVAGVCSSCLRERLFALIAAQAQADAEQLHNHHYHNPHQHHHLHHNHHHLDGAQLARTKSREAAETSRKSDSHAHPPPLVFPRSVSPYVSHRKSDNTFGPQPQRFYSTPQAGPTYTSFSAGSTTGNFSAFSKKKNGNRFSFLTRLFRSRSEKLNPDPHGNGPRVCTGDSCEPSASSSPLWLSNIFSGRRKKQPPICSSLFSGPIGRRRRRWADRGMSPERSAYSDDDGDRSQTGSGASSECSQAWRKTPTRRGKTGHSRNLSDLAFCLSPLVTAGPSRQWNQKAGLPPDMGFSGEMRVQGKPRLSAAASYCANRSRKLVDFGKVNHNR